MRQKRGNIFFNVHDPQAQVTLAGDISRILPKWQYLTMLHNPDLILQFSHFLGNFFKAQGNEML